MKSSEQSARDELRNELRGRLESYIQQAEICKRVIQREKLQLENYEGKIVVLRETLEKLK